MYNSISNDILEIDIHYYDVYCAKKQLEHLLANLDEHINEVKVIHGYKSGDALLRMVRYDLRSKRILRRIISLNPGITSLIIKRAG